MNIALDFDKTFTVDPRAWVDFIQLMNKWGHTVFIVTARDRFNDGINWATVGLGGPPAPVIWCDGVPKQVIAAENGITFDVWIDDNPATIITPSAYSRNGLKEWRKQDKHRGSVEEPHGNSRGIQMSEEAHGKVDDKPRSA